ncbi:MAG: c-type cytochrome [Vicinamibacterales bacterium]
MHEQTETGTVPTSRAVALVILALTAGLAACSSAPPAPDPAHGRTLYATNGCAACHGESGQGDGRLGLTLTPRPPDFHDASAFRNPRNIDKIAEVIAAGAAARPTPMPAYDYLPETERRDLAAFVLSLAEAPAP